MNTTTHTHIDVKGSRTKHSHNDCHICLLLRRSTSDSRPSLRESLPHISPMPHRNASQESTQSEKREKTDFFPTRPVFAIQRGLNSHSAPGCQGPIAWLEAVADARVAAMRRPNHLSTTSVSDSAHPPAPQVASRPLTICRSSPGALLGVTHSGSPIPVESAGRVGYLRAVWAPRPSYGWHKHARCGTLLRRGAIHDLTADMSSKASLGARYVVGA